MVARNKSKKYNRSKKSTRNKRQSRKNKHSTNKKGGVPGDAVNKFLHSLTDEEREKYGVDMSNEKHETDDHPVLSSSVEAVKEVEEFNAAAASPPVKTDLNPAAKEWLPGKGGKSNKRKKQSRKRTIHNKRK
jgi:hypothetical protein